MKFLIQQLYYITTNNMANNLVKIERPVTSAQNAICLNIISDVITMIKTKHS